MRHREIKDEAYEAFKEAEWKERQKKRKAMLTKNQEQQKVNIETKKHFST